MNLILCGLQNSGKTTVGKLLAKKLGWDCLDTDQMIEKSQGKPCREIYKNFGRETFRNLENKMIATLEGTTNSVISIGGGSLVRVENKEILSNLGKSIYLKAELDLLWKRMDQVPVYVDPVNPKEGFFELAKARLPLFESFASYTVATDTLTPDEIVDMIIESIGNEPLECGDKS